MVPIHRGFLNARAREDLVRIGEVATLSWEYRSELTPRVILVPLSVALGYAG